jgi:hypothetical protein
MCDYSVMSFPNRLAKNGEELVVHRFAGGVIGLASPLNLKSPRNPLTARLGTVWADLCGTPGERRTRSVVAVCVPPGTHLMVRDIPTELQQEFDVGRTEEVMFTQISSAPFQTRDAVRFLNGHEVLLQRLKEGQRVRVLGVLSADLADSARELHGPVGHRRQPPIPLLAAARGYARRHCTLFTSGVLDYGTI